MAYQEKIPPINVKLNAEKYNVLIEFIDKSLINIEDEQRQDRLKKLKEKLLKYSVPYNENGIDLVNARFYIREASNIIDILINNLNNIEISKNYYQLLQDSRKIYNLNKENR